MKTLLLTALSVAFSTGLMFGQTEQTSSYSSSTKHTSVNKTSNVKAEKLQNNDNVIADGYLGYKEQILKRLVVKEIPQNFPLPNKDQTRESYKRAVLGWFKKNPDMIKQEYQAELKK